LRHDLLDWVDGRLGLEASLADCWAEGLAEGGEGLLVGPDVDDGESGVCAVADMVKPVRLVDDSVSCVEDLLILLDGLTGCLATLSAALAPAASPAVPRDTAWAAPNQSAGQRAAFTTAADAVSISAWVASAAITRSRSSGPS